MENKMKLYYIITCFLAILIFSCVHKSRNDIKDLEFKSGIGGQNVHKSNNDNIRPDKPLTRYPAYLHLRSSKSEVEVKIIKNLTGKTPVEPEELILVTKAAVGKQVQNMEGLNLSNGLTKAVNELMQSDIDKLTVKDVYANKQKVAIDADAVVDSGEIVFRGMTLKDDQLNTILNQGIESPAIFFKDSLPNGTKAASDIESHQAGYGNGADSRNSIFVSTSESAKVAYDFIKNGDGFVFHIKTSKQGVDINQALGTKSGGIPKLVEIDVTHF